MIRLFEPILAGASLRDRMIACLGAALGIGATALAGLLLARLEPGLVMIVAPVGASAVLVFVVPASPLAQPWSVIGGNIASAVTGLAVVALAGASPLTAGLAVAAAILVMTFLRCLHPPGGAVALGAVIAAASHHPAVPLTAVSQVAFNSAVLVACGLAFHRFSRHAYPHRPGTARVPTPVVDDGFERRDVEAALADLGETFDIDRADLELLLHQTELRAQMRRASGTGARA